VTSGAPRRASAGLQRSPGFTLLEVIVTLLILALATALAMPAIGRGTEGIRARSQATRFSALLRHTREQAITARKPHEVAVDPETGRVTVKVGRDDPRTALTLSERVKIEANPPTAVTVRFEPYGGSTGGDFLLTSSTFRYHVTVDAITGRVRTERAQ
jgi:prepilin-type N-terminal cleavage/methylation domain-containing protein